MTKEIDNNELFSLAEKTIKLAQKLGADQSEVYIINGNSLSIDIEESSIVKANNKSNTGIGLRALKNKAIGLGSSSQFDKKSIESMVTDTISLAKASSPDPNLLGFASHTNKFPAVSGLVDKKIVSMESSEVVDIAIKGLNAALKRDSQVNASGSVNVSYRDRIIYNSNGVNASNNSTFIQMYISSKITKNDEIGVGFDYNFGRSLSKINAEQVGAKATDKAFSTLGGQKIETGDYPFLLDERAARSTINIILSQGISAFNIIQGTAFFNDRLGEIIANDQLTVIDNPLENAGAASRSFDDEGSPSKKLTLLNKGTLMTYLSDVYTANKLSIPNTGSSSKQGYAGIPHPELSQIQIEPGTKTKDELFGELDKGIYLENPLFSIAGTNISQQVDVGYWVEKGEIKYPIKNTMLGITVYDVLKKIKSLGKDILIESGTKSPMILFDTTKFSSGK